MPRARARRPDWGRPGRILSFTFDYTQGQTATAPAAAAAIELTIERGDLARSGGQSFSVRRFTVQNLCVFACVCMQPVPGRCNVGLKKQRRVGDEGRSSRPRAEGRTHGARPEKTEASGTGRSGGNSRWESADVKYLGQLERETESQRGSLQERPRRGNGDWRRRSLFDWNPATTGSQTCAKTTRTVRCHKH